MAAFFRRLREFLMASVEVGLSFKKEKASSKSNDRIAQSNSSSVSDFVETIRKIDELRQTDTAIRQHLAHLEIPSNMPQAFFIEYWGFCEDDDWWWLFSSSNKAGKNGGHGHCIRVSTGTRFYYDQGCQRYVRWVT